MTWLLYVALVTVVAAAVPGMLWLRRRADAAWAEHQRQERLRQLFKPTADAFLRFQVVVGDRMTPVLQRLGREIARLNAELERKAALRQFDEAVRKLREKGIGQ